MEHLCVLQLETALATLVTTIFFNVNCKTPNVVYLLDCHVCGSQCVGESVQPFNKRMNGHRSDLTKKTLLSVRQHFRHYIHRSGLNLVNIMPTHI
jgi:hypothetical protein